MNNRKLENIDRKLPFDAPDGYFEDLSMRVQRRVAKENMRPSYAPVFTWKWATMPALLLLIGAIAYFYQPSINTETTMATLSHTELIEQVSEETIADYLMEEERWHQAELYELATSESSPNQSALNNELLEEEVLKEINLHELEDYL